MSTLKTFKQLLNYWAILELCWWWQNKRGNKFTFTFSVKTYMKDRHKTLENEYSTCLLKCSRYTFILNENNLLNWRNWIGLSSRNTFHYLVRVRAALVPSVPGSSRGIHIFKLLTKWFWWKWRCGGWRIGWWPHNLRSSAHQVERLPYRLSPDRSDATHNTVSHPAKPLPCMDTSQALFARCRMTCDVGWQNGHRLPKRWQGDCGNGVKGHGVKEVHCYILHNFCN